MAPTFPSISTARRAIDKAGEQQFFDDLHDRDEGLREQPFFLELAEVSEDSSSYPGTEAREWYIDVPPWATILKVVLDTKVTATTTGTYKGTLGASMDSDEPTETGSAYDPANPTVLTWSDVSSLAGKSVQLRLFMKNSPGGGGNDTFALQIEGPACYFTV
jgi:hypothetical protein